MLKPANIALVDFVGMQPPSGGCVLKHFVNPCKLKGGYAAAFGRLCVETVAGPRAAYVYHGQPPSGGCVLKQFWKIARLMDIAGSRLRAAVC